MMDALIALFVFMLLSGTTNLVEACSFNRDDALNQYTYLIEGYDCSIVPWDEYAPCKYFYIEQRGRSAQSMSLQDLNQWFENIQKSPEAHSSADLNRVSMGLMYGPVTDTCGHPVAHLWGIRE